MNAQEQVQQACIIQGQIGSQALMMLGANNFTYDKKGLGFGIRGSRKARHVKVELNGDDTYTVRFTNWRGSNLGSIKRKEVKGVYADMLANIIKDETGLEIKLV